MLSFKVLRNSREGFYMLAGKGVRLNEFINPDDGRSLIIEADFGLMLGPVEGLEDLMDVVEKVVEGRPDGVILSLGMAERLIHSFLGKKSPALLLRADWTNALRNKTHPLPANRVRRVSMASAEEALLLGASAVVAYLFVGYEDDEDEAENLKAVATLAEECSQVGMPLLVQSIPIGERVTMVNYADCVGLAVRMAMEAGADVVAAPYTGSFESFKGVVAAAKGAPFLMLDMDVKLAREQPTQEYLKALEESLKAGAAGAIFGRRVLGKADLAKALEDVRGEIHRSGREG